MPDLTPTEELVADVLAARWGTGSREWYFRRNRTVTAAVARLEQRGLVIGKCRAQGQIDTWMTEAGRAAWLDDSAKTPDQKRIAELEAELAAALTTIRLMSLGENHG